MAKALIAIGVGNTDGSFPKLKGAVRDAEEFSAWGKEQGFDCTLLVDNEGTKVRVADVYEAIDHFVQAGTYSQVVVYFSGHGILKAPDCELWLMSGAPRNVNEVINVRGSITNARSCGIEHVVFISDACRSLPTDMRTSALNVGQNVFPFIAYRAPMPEVDVFYATLPGDTALEVPPDPGSQRDRGLLTQCLLDALAGNVHEVIHSSEVDGIASRVVPCRPLKTWLTTAVPLAASLISFKLQQLPDIRIESDLSRYLAKLAADASPVKPSPSSVEVPRGHSLSEPLTAYNVAGARRLVPSRGSEQRRGKHAKAIKNLESAAEPIAASLPGMRADSTLLRTTALAKRLKMGFVVQDGIICSATGMRGPIAIARDENHSWIDLAVRGPRGDDGRMSGGQPVALRFQNGSGTVLAAIPGYVAVVVMDGDLVATVNYKPAAGSRNYTEYLAVAEDLEERHAAVAREARNGRFAVGSLEVDEFAESMRKLKLIDPTLCMYACYAYARAGLFEGIADIHALMSNELELMPFDVEMLASQFGDSPFPRAQPQMPMLTQGWLMLGRFEHMLPEPLGLARQFLLPSLWATFSREGMRILERYLFGA